MGKPRRQFTAEFKQEAVDLLQGNRKTATHAARDLALESHADFARQLEREMPACKPTRMPWLSKGVSFYRMAEKWQLEKPRAPLC